MKEKKIHVHGDFIVWINSTTKLEELIKLLIRENLIFADERKDIEKIIEGHFSHAEIRNDENSKKILIHWVDKQPLLIYLLKELSNNEFVARCNHIYKLVAPHFKNYEGNPMNNEQLGRAFSKSKNNDNKKPRNFEVVDKIILTLQGKIKFNHE